MSNLITIHEFPGGVHPPENKQQSTRTAIATPPLSAEYVLPLNQHSGSPAQVLVKVGDSVLKGQLLARASGFVSAPVHAPTSGTITAIEARKVPHPSGLTETCIVLASDGDDHWCELFPEPDYTTVDHQALIRRIYDAGIVGLGGAGFPAAVKMASRNEDKIHTLVVNGAECEPYITADDMLMRERADRIVSGIDILCHLLHPEQVLIGIEDNKPDAAKAMERACQDRAYQVVTVPTKYPSGDAQRLIYLLTGREVPSDARSVDIGILCYNTGTIAAIHDAIILGRPLISRITTLTGDALAQPQNVEALIGTPANDLLAFAGLRQDSMNNLVLGGPMMGFTLDSTDIPVIKTTNCLIAGTAQEFPAAPPARACIRCGDCAVACPVSLLPQQLYWHAKAANNDQLQHHNLFDCIECGACSYVCPSNIPLVQYFRAGKDEIRLQQAKHEKAEQSKRRFENRQQRLERMAAEKEAKRKANAERAAQLKAAREAEKSAPAKASEATADEGKQDAIQAAIERAKARKQAAAGQPASEPIRKARPTLNPRQKELKIQLSMINAQLKKTDRTLAQLDDSDSETAAKLQADIDRLREQQAQLQQDFDQAGDTTESVGTSGSQAAQPPKAAKPSLSDDQKKLKIELAMARAELRKTERALAEALEIDNDQTEALKVKVENCRQILAEREQAVAESADNGTPAPTQEKPAKSKRVPLSDAAKKHKIESAMAWAKVKKARRALENTSADDDMTTLEQALKTAETEAQQADDALAACLAQETAPSTAVNEQPKE
ncbi:electron transport complex subunit RsxC [Kistimonas asteriae]|uniref:electron transport complex subunit RsxC n=1 Tax=Kistimonas asteriae TaxID=517724 RepID=UPI001BA7FC54|nr:electron transport complex subunit RsxC [Kistimonas asteriae]